MLMCVCESRPRTTPLCGQHTHRHTHTTRGRPSRRAPVRAARTRNISVAAYAARLPGLAQRAGSAWWRGLLAVRPWFRLCHRLFGRRIAE